MRVLTGSMSEEREARLAALRKSCDRSPWTVQLIVECASDPGEIKRRSQTCATCSAPCEEEEVCSTVIAKEGELFDCMGREQVYHLLESGMNRLEQQSKADIRTKDGRRPNTFVSLTEAATEEENKK